MYFDPFGNEYIPQEVLIKVKDKSITHNIFGVQNDDSIICGFYRIAFIDYVIAGKNLLDYTNLYCGSDFKKSYNVIYKYFKGKYGKS